MSYRTENSATEHLLPLLLAVGGGAVAAATTVTFLLVMETPEFSFDVLSAFAFALLLTFPVVLSVAVLLGLPLTFFLSSRQAENAVVYPALGFLAGSLFFPALHALLSDYPSDATVMGLLAVVGGIPGAVTGVIWWLADRRHVQDG